MTWTPLLFLTLAVPLLAKTIDNRLIGTPEVICGPDEVRIRGVSEDIFEGQIFVKRARRVPECAIVYDISENSTKPEFGIPLQKIHACGIEMKRNTEQKSLELQAVISISFHPELITSGDRAYSVHCVFQQQQMTVGTNVDFIKDITPSAVLGGTADPPRLTLNIVGAMEGGESTLPLTTVPLGHAIMLVWTLEQTSPLYGIRVLGCTAETPDGRGLRVIDNSCSIADQGLVSDVRYSDDQTRAFADIKAFKYPDVDEMIFKCAVKPCIKRFDHLQVDASVDASDLCTERPDCGHLFGRNSTVRARRMTDDLSIHFIDPSAELVSGKIIMIDEYGSLKRQYVAPEALRSDSATVSNTVCLSQPFAITVISACSLIIMTTVAVLIANCMGKIPS